MALDPITAGLDLANNVINKIWPDKSEQEKQELAGVLVLMQGQMAVNQTEASSADPFTSRARPFIMWVCGTALLYASLIEPIGRFVAQTAFHYAGPFPAINTDVTMQVLLGLLGLGTMRTYEKVRGVAK